MHAAVCCLNSVWHVGMPATLLCSDTACACAQRTCLKQVAESPNMKAAATILANDRPEAALCDLCTHLHALRTGECCVCVFASLLAHNMLRSAAVNHAASQLDSCYNKCTQFTKLF